MGSDNNACIFSCYHPCWSRVINLHLLLRGDSAVGFRYSEPVIAMLKTIVPRARWAALSLILCTVCGCASESLNSNSPNIYTLTVSFFGFDAFTIIQEIKIDVRPGVPFKVKKQDSAGNSYQVAGTLRQMSQDTFQLNPGTIKRYNGASNQESSGPVLNLGKLGSGHGWAAIDGGFVHNGQSVVLAKK